MGLATLGGIAFLIDPSAITWSYSIKTAVQETVGGKVVQVFGTSIDDMTVSGKFSSWKEQAAFLKRVEGWIDYSTESTKPGFGDSGNDQPPLRFTYAPRGWDFLVYVSKFDQPGGGDSISMTSTTLAPPWSLTLFVVEDNHGLRGIRDDAMKMYIERLATGIGWKQTVYNGPLASADVQAYLSGEGFTTIAELLTSNDTVVADGPAQ